MEKITKCKTKDEVLQFIAMENRNTIPMKKKLGYILKHIILIAVGISMILPFFWMISTSLKTSNNVFTIPPQWIPSPIELHNYVDVFYEVPFLRYILNT